MAKTNFAKRIFTPKDGEVDFLLIFDIVVLLIFGLLTLFSASIPYAETDKGTLSLMTNQFIFAAVGLAGMTVLSRIDYSLIRKYYRLEVIAAIGAMFLVAIFGFASHGAQRQLSIGPMSFQPSEIAKYLLVMYFAARLSRKKSDVNKFRGNMLEYMIVMGLIVLACFLQNHLSACIILVGVPALMLLLAGLNWKWTAAGIGAAAAALVFVFGIFSEDSFRANRIASFTGEKELEYQVKQSLYAVGSGGLFGLGPGQSRQKYFYLPEVRNDYIFAVLCEELGFIGAVLMLILFAVLVWRGFSIAINAPDRYSSFLAFGITAVIGLQVLINVAVVTNTIPSTGMQLPLFSSGGSSMIFTLWALGILLGISRKRAPKGAKS